MSTSLPARNIPKVFCSHRSVDKPRVREIARQLREAGIDAWLDQWEINPGDDFVAAINSGLATCDIGLIFFSNEVEAGKWVQAEISALTVDAIENGKPVIPVMLDPDTPVPPLLRSRCRLASDQLDQLIDAILGRSSKPPLGPPPTTAARTRRFTVHLRQPEPSQFAVSAELEGNPVADERPVRLGHDFHFSYSGFQNARLPGARQSAAALSVERERELHQFGDAIGRVLFHGDIEAAFTGLLSQARAANEAIELTVETEVPQLLAIPFEAARLPDGRTPALESGVRMVRRLAGVPPEGNVTQPGPLKILVAVGAPDEGQTRNTVLDMERELQSILDAVEKARALGNAYVRILDVGSIDQVRSSLQEQAYHVLHLSGHGNAGVLELEDEDGRAVAVRAADIADAIRDSGHPAPLVFLASCLGGAGDSETVSLAQGLLQRGVPSVMAMQTSVTDNYSTQLAAAFYTNLSTSDRPLASNALALARQQLERKRREDLARGQHVPAEYATPSLFCSGEERPILDRSLEFVRPLEHKRALSSGAVPILSIGDLIGRRVELRRVMRVLTDDERSIAEIGRRAGCQILGIGGVGKSAITGRAMARLADLGWTCVAITGKWTIGEICANLSATLWSSDNPELKEMAGSLSQNLPDQVRLQLIASLLSQHEVLLVLDNFEDNLNLKTREFLDPATASVMQLLYRSAQRGKILITSRYPVPGADDWLATEEPGPLSPAQTRKLMLRLTALSAQEPEGLRLIQRAIGGHPRMLEYLDAILRQGKARLPDVARRLRAQAAKQGINLADSGATLTDAIQVALRVGAGDILLLQLVELVAEHDGDLEILCQASVFSSPVSVDAMAFCVADGREADQEQIVHMRNAVERIAQSSLLTRTSEGNVWVHRWTAEVIAKRTEPEAFRNYCRRGGEYLTSRQRTIVEAIEATRLFLAAQEFDQASDEGSKIVKFLRRYGQVADLGAVARELAEELPPDHANLYYFMSAEADALRSLGFSKEALAKHQHIMGTLEQHLKLQPDRADLQRELSVSYERAADLLRDSGKGEHARSYYQQALEIRERLARQEPDRADLQRSLSVSYERAADLLRDSGKGEHARSYYQQALEIRERLAHQEPDRADLQRDLFVSCGLMADLLSGLGQGEQARGYYQKSLDIAERLAREEPGRADFQRDLALSYERMGDALLGLGQAEQTTSYFQKSLDIRERLARQEPDRADLQRELSVSYNQMGKLLLDLGHGEQALSYFQKDLDIAERLARQEPDRADLQRDLSVSYNQMGDLLRSLRLGEQALSYFQNGLDIAERLARQEPYRADLQRDLAISFGRIGDSLVDSGRGEETRSYFQRSLDIRERLARQVVALHRLGDRESLLRALGILRQLEQEQKLTPQHQSWIPLFEAKIKETE